LLSLGIKYSMRDLIWDVNFCMWEAKLRYASHYASALLLSSFNLRNLWIPSETTFMYIENHSKLSAYFSTFIVFMFSVTTLSYKLTLSYQYHGFLLLEHNNWWRHKWGNTWIILVLFIHSNLRENLASWTCFQHNSMKIRKWLVRLDRPVGCIFYKVILYFLLIY